MKFRSIFGLAIVSAVGLFVQATRANTISFGASGSGVDGPVGATVDFTSGAGVLIVTLTNTGTTVKQGQAISGLTFSLAGFSTSSGISRIVGVEYTLPSSGTPTWTLGSGTAFDNSLAHGWTYSPGDLTTIGGGQPDDMIFPGVGSWGSGSPADQFNPYLLGPTKFYLTSASMTLGTNLTGLITNVVVTYGTSRETSTTGTPTGNPPPPPVPLPAAVWSGVALLAGLGITRKVRKHLEK